MFVDASALVAILTEEVDGPELSRRLSKAVAPVTSAVAVYETALVLAHKGRHDAVGAYGLIERYLARAKVNVVDIPPEASALAVDAFQRYGKGRHPAKLNLGDCFAYAMAKREGVPLLYKGDDFARTDLA